MENLRLQFADPARTERPLSTGVHRVVRQPGGTLGIGDQAQGALLARICVDRRGLWLQVASGMRGVHVNGRPVQRMALLRAGDTVHVDGVELQFLSSCHEIRTPPPRDDVIEGDPRIALRGVGGVNHGRSFPLDRPLLVGRSPEAALRIDDPDCAERHAQLELQGDRVLLRALDGRGSRVNGRPVRDALLGAGDQIFFGPQHRYVVEIPWVSGAGLGDEAPVQETPGPTPAAEPAKAATPALGRWPWLLLAAAMMASALGALLLFGAV
ncbi:FHA domain-containing protein [Pseudoxanthomonas mexicana]|uniref:FHA domain-containing protein n=1 Tax=Pseudoxanthomonas mexicana TaxID=128785 RepID=UPI00398B2E6F